MSEKTKEDQLKEKLLEFFDKKLSEMTTKFTSDINTIESYKNDYFDSVIKVYREILQEQKQIEEQEKQELKEKQEKQEKKVEEPKHEKIPKKKINNSNRERPKTPLGTNKVRIKSDKEKEKEKHDTTDIHIKDKKKINTTIGTRSGKGRVATEANTKRPVTGKVKTQIGKRNKKDDKKTKGKKETKKEEPKEEIKEEPKIEEKKPVIIKPKYIINIPEEIKTNINLVNIYFILKKNYLDKKQVLYLSQGSPLLYKSFGNNMKFLLEEKKTSIEKKAKEIESFLNNYGDLNTYLTKEFSLTKKAMSSLSMFKKKEEEDVLKMQELPNEVGRILKCLYYLLDEKFEENMNSKQLFENMLTNILEKSEDKTFKGLLVNYFNKNKFLNLTQEKADNINKIVIENNNILNMIAITKMCRPISLFCFLLKEIHDYINLKTSDGHYYYELRAKNDQLQKYLDFIYLYDNNGKVRNPPKEEIKKEEEEKPKEENAEKVEEQKVEETQNNEEKPKEENKEIKEEQKEEKDEEKKTEEIKVEEESVKKEEEQAKS